MKTAWYDGIAAHVRTHRRHDDEGAFWVIFLEDERRPVNAAAFSEAHEIDAAGYDGLASIVDGVDAPAVVFVVPRDDGEPLAHDWRAWEEMRARLAVSRCELVDLVVVGHYSWWAAVGGRPGVDRAGVDRAGR